jgi:hypothetical protein
MIGDYRKIVAAALFRHLTDEGAPIHSSHPRSEQMAINVGYALTDAGRVVVDKSDYDSLVSLADRFVLLTDGLVGLDGIEGMYRDAVAYRKRRDGG